MFWRAEHKNHCINTFKEILVEEFGGGWGGLVSVGRGLVSDRGFTNLLLKKQTLVLDIVLSQNLCNSTIFYTSL